MKVEISCRLSCLSAISLIAAMVPSAMADPLTNGDFESGLSPWDTEGTVTIEDAGYGGNAAVLYEADSRGLSRIYQEFDIPAGTQWLSFRYRLFSNSYGDSVVPPDSFTALLIDPITGNRLVLPSEADPPLELCKGLLYQDVRGELVINDSDLTFSSAIPDVAGFVGGRTRFAQGVRI